MDALLRDLRLAARSLRHTPSFALAAVLTLALGIGANTAIFGLVDALLLRPLPYRDPARLVNLWETYGHDAHGGVAYPNFLEWQRRQTSFDQLAAWSPQEMDVTGDGRADRILGEGVTPDYFSLLGLNVLEGRVFRADENDGRPLVILSQALWQSRFGSAPDVLGRTLNLSGTPFTIVGVMSAGVHGLSGTAQLWVPLATHPLIYPQVARFDFLHSRDIHWLHAIGHLKAGVSVEAARAEMRAIGDQLAAAYPNENRERSVGLASMQADATRNLRPALLALLAAVGFGLLVACANVANLILVRLAQRGREAAIRVALGARRSHLLRQLFAEALLIAAFGSALGLLVYAAIKDVLPALLPMQLPKFATLALDASVLAFAAILLIISGAALTIIPALHFSRRDLQSALSSGARGTDSRGLHRLRGGLASFEVALALLLTIGAGLMIKSFWRLRGSDPGFRPDHLLTLRFDVPNGKYTGATRLSLGDEIAERVKQLPGVADAAVTMVDPFIWPGLNRGFTIENHTNVMNPESVYYEEITPGYFRTMSIPLLAGRDFTPTDDEKSPVVIVSQSFARRYWPGQDAIGKRLRIGKNTQPWLSVIGVVADAQIDDLHQSKSDLALFYSPLRRSEAIISLSILVRSKVDPASLIAPIRNELQRFDPDMPVYSVATLEERLAGEAAGARSYAVLMSLFGAIALSLAVIGTYGVIAFAAAQRMREIGIRIALGAQAADILRMMTAHGLRIALVGLGIGIIAAFALTRFLATLLFGVSSHDPLIFAGIAVLLVF